jgi:hypothetical protein
MFHLISILMALMLIKTCCSFLPCGDKIQEYVKSTDQSVNAVGNPPSAPSSQDFIRLRQLIADIGHAYKPIGISPESAVSLFKAVFTASSVLWHCLNHDQSSSPNDVLDSLHHHLKILIISLRKFE